MIFLHQKTTTICRETVKKHPEMTAACPEKTDFHVYQVI